MHHRTLFDYQKQVSLNINQTGGLLALIDWKLTNLIWRNFWNLWSCLNDYSEDDMEFRALIDQWLQKQTPELQPSLTAWAESYLVPSGSTLYYQALISYISLRLHMFLK